MKMPPLGSCPATRNIAIRYHLNSLGPKTAPISEHRPIIEPYQTAMNGTERLNSETRMQLLPQEQNQCDEGHKCKQRDASETCHPVRAEDHPAPGHGTLESNCNAACRGNHEKRKKSRR